MEILTLAQTRKLDREIPVLLYGPAYWNEVMNFDALVRHGMIDAEDLRLFEFTDSPANALDCLKRSLSPASEPETTLGSPGRGTPAFAPCRTPESGD
jgi:predicted Rossmann-fold nucleotide-binding protein